MEIQNNGKFSIEQLTDQYLGSPRRTQVRKATDGQAANGLSFQDVLQLKTQADTGNLKFSKHAMGRLADRNIELSDSQLERLDSLAFIVNVPNQTVVTAMDSTETNENIFTNINGAVIM